ncbi:MAG: Fis family transcriptional regulator [Verrucomicrobia bacterium]|nr:MAG: Fis family transcriptional regulator [Verrucomicrobiota bacterium]
MANARRSPNLPIQAFSTLPSSPQTLPSEAVLDALKMMLIGASLNEVLTSVTRLIEAHSEGMLCSIFLLDEDGLHLRYGVAANLPQAYQAATDGVCIGPNVGSCGAAAYLRQPVFISDMLSHPNWEGFRDVVLQSGLRAAWSTPILSHDGKVLGTFCMYYREVRQPVMDEIQLIDYASRIAAIAIERKRAEEKLRQDEREFRQLIDFLPQHVLVLDKEGFLLQANQVMLDYNGHTLEEMQGAGTDERVKRDLHPDDLERVRDERRRGFSSRVPFEIEKRMLGKDGRYRWFLFRYKPLLNEQGGVTRWFATATDIDDRKRAEERMRNENLALREEIDRSSMYEEIVGSSNTLRVVLQHVAKVAPTDSTVLILGETGTGKELIARAIHKRSKRSAGAFIRVNCVAIPSSLIASELFGHEKGAFTGALQRRLGRFELADGGTIFLDEIGDLPADTQNALLRVLQEREFERVGGTQTIRVNVRVIAATNRDLGAAVASGSFREDLFYRLNVFPIDVPSLRERADDITLLVEYLVARSAKRAGKKIRHIEKATLDLFKAYTWPGNIRELQNVVERAVILCEGDTLSVDESWFKHDTPRSPGTTQSLPTSPFNQEREMIEAALRESRGRIAGPFGAATKLGIPRQTLDSKIAALGIDKYRFKT